MGSEARTVAVAVGGKSPEAGEADLRVQGLFGSGVRDARDDYPSSLGLQGRFPMASQVTRKPIKCEGTRRVR